LPPYSLSLDISSNPLTHPRFTSSEDIIIVFIVICELSARWDDLLFRGLSSPIHCTIVAIVTLALPLALGLLCCLDRLLLLFVVLSLLQAHEVLTINLIELLLDVVNDLLDARDHNELKSVHSSVCHF